MTTEINSMTTSIPLAREFPPHTFWNKVVPSIKDGAFEFGSKNQTKMINFLDKYNLTSQEIIEYRNRGPAREENEDFEDYRIRRTFQQHLFKYRTVVKHFIIRKAMQSILDNKINKEKE